MADASLIRIPPDGVVLLGDGVTQDRSMTTEVVA